MTLLFIILLSSTLNDDHVVFGTAENLRWVNVLGEHHQQHDEGDHGEEDHRHVVRGRLHHQAACLVHLWHRGRGGYQETSWGEIDVSYDMYKYIIFHSQLAGVGREATRGKSARSKAPPILSSISSSLSLMEEILCFYLFVSATFPIQDYNLK